MALADKADWSGAASDLARSYIADLRRWVTRRAVRYAVAVAISVGGILALFAAASVAVAAFFNAIEHHYGADVAYASVGGGLLGVGIILLLVAWAMLRRHAPPLPRPHRQAAFAKKMIMRSATVRTGTGLRTARSASADPVTRALIGAAATMLVGWMVASRLESRSQQPRIRR